MRRGGWRALALVVATAAACDGPAEVAGPVAGPPADVAAVGPSGAGTPSRGSAGPSGPDADDAAPVGPSPLDDPYRGLGTWIDIYDLEAWDHPARTVRAMRRHGVHTIYLQTSNSSRGRPFVHPEEVVALLDAAARGGLDVVAWYLPGFRDLRTDLRRTLAAIRLTTPSGNRFASFALDIESPEVSRQLVRTRRLLVLTERIRLAVGEAYPLGAIVPSPRRLRTDPWFWPSFPYRRLAEAYDVFLPMTYFTWRVSGREGASWYTAKNILILRQETAGMNVPIHVIGGIAADASDPETRGFVRTIRSRNVIGASYYTFPMIRDEQWSLLRAIG
jgi:hypothetical protein